MNGLIMPNGQPILDSRGQDINAARGKISPQQFISRIIRRVEAARRQGIDQTCNIIVALATEGWMIVEDKNLQTTRAAVTLASHLTRDVNGIINTKEERILRLGSDFVPALMKLHEERQKAEERAGAEIDALKKEFVAPHDPKEDIPDAEEV